MPRCTRGGCSNNGSRRRGADYTDWRCDAHWPRFKPERELMEARRAAESKGWDR